MRPRSHTYDFIYHTRPIKSRSYYSKVILMLSYYFHKFQMHCVVAYIFHTFISSYIVNHLKSICDCVTTTLDTFFHQIKSFLRFRLAFVFGLQTYYLIVFSKIYQLKGLEPKNKG